MCVIKIIRQIVGGGEKMCCVQSMESHKLSYSQKNISKFIPIKNSSLVQWQHLESLVVRS